MFLMFHIVSYQFPPADGHLGSFQIIPIILIWLWCFQVENNFSEHQHQTWPFHDGDGSEHKLAVFTM